SEVHPANFNANISIVYSALMYVLRLVVEDDIPLNEGLLRFVQIELPPNTFLHPHFVDSPEQCPAVVGGNTEVSQRLVDTLLKAFGLAAASQGTMNNFLFGNAAFGYYETIGGGVGAGPGFHGRSGVHQHMTNTRITDPEDLERVYPVRLREFSLRQGSGGVGKWQGGDGLVREVEALVPLEVTLLTQRRASGPYGQVGRNAGQAGVQYQITADGQRIKLEGVTSVSLQPKERIRIETPGGGGWG
ncbi:MAG: hydantoinase B/oxoprolinase family protein, partial [Bacteroidota bacterium]